MNKINILGTEYTYKTNCDEKDYPLLKVNEAYTDHSTKEIIILQKDSITDEELDKLFIQTRILLETYKELEGKE